MQDTTRLTALISEFFKNFERVSAEIKKTEPNDDPQSIITVGYRIENNSGVIDDGAATYNSYGKPMNDWQRSQQDDGWVTQTKYDPKL